MKYLKQYIFENFNKAKNMYFLIRNTVVSACVEHNMLWEQFTLQHLYTYIEDISRQIFK